MSEPVKLHAYSGVNMTNTEIADWAHLWAGHIETNSRPLRTLVIIAESEDGELGVISTGRPSDKCRMLGLMHVATDAVLQNGDNDEKAGFLREDIP